MTVPDGAAKDNTSKLKAVVFLLSLSSVGLLAATITLAVQNGRKDTTTTTSAESTNADSAGEKSDESTYYESKSRSVFFSDDITNVCEGAKLALDSGLCADLNVPQSGSNVTKGYIGDLDVGDVLPNIEKFWESGMCPVNVHWHLGTEHYSLGEYDEYGDGPNGNIPRPEWAHRDLDSAASEVNASEERPGFRCHHYDASDPRFTTEYNWKHCIGMEVGETYEVHWPHSAAGACGTVDQYQEPFYDGVFCHLSMEVFENLSQQEVANAVGVQGQVFTIVNDESYFYPDMIRGMIVDGEMGKDVVHYTGSTTGTSVNNEECSQYAPITWQVDRKCHMISASSFDKLCYDMKMQRDDMSNDLRAHGSRELVSNEYVANNQQRNLRS